LLLCTLFFSSRRCAHPHLHSFPTRRSSDLHLVAQSRLRSPFLTWTWQREWTRAFAADRRLEIRRVEDAEGRLVALLPLHEAAPGVLTLIGGADISDYL